MRVLSMAVAMLLRSASPLRCSDMFQALETSLNPFLTFLMTCFPSPIIITHAFSPLSKAHPSHLVFDRPTPLCMMTLMLMSSGFRLKIQPHPKHRKYCNFIAMQNFLYVLHFRALFQQLDCHFER